MTGLPDGRCQCPHWGYVPVKHEPGTELVIFSPAEEMRKMKNMQAMQGG
jgi:hypothetical protein